MCEAEASSSEATAPGVSDEIFGGDQFATTGLNELLDHLLGGGTRVLADAGLSRFCPRRLSAIQSGEIVRNLTLAGKMMAIFAVATLLHKAPDFVYKAF